MGKLIEAIFGRSRTQPLPSMLEALTAIVGKKKLEWVILSTPDRRQIVETVARHSEVHVNDLIRQAATKMGVPFLPCVASVDLAVLPKEIRLASFKKAGAIPFIANGELVGLVCVDPSAVLPLLDMVSAKGKLSIFLSSWSEISRALDKSEEDLALAQRREESQRIRKERQAAAKAIGLVIEQVSGYGQNYVEFVLGYNQVNFEFLTKDFKKATGEVNGKLYSALLIILEELSVQEAPRLMMPDGIVRGDLAVEMVKPNQIFRMRWGIEVNPRGQKSALDMSESQKLLPGKPIEVDSEIKSALVLIVEDNPIFANVLERFLVRHKLQVLSAESCAQGWEFMVGSRTPELVICDLHLPDGSGLDLLRRIRSESVLAELPVVVLTSDEDVETELSALNSGADAYVAKSEDPRLLCAQVVRLLKKVKLKRAA